MEKKTHLYALIKNAILYSFGYFFSQLIGFLLIPVYTRLLSVSDYGALGIVQTTQTLIIIILGFGLSNALSRIYYDNQNPIEKLKYTATIFWFNLLTVFLFSLLSLSFVNGLNKVFFNGTQSNLIVYILIFSILPILVSNTCISFVQIKIQPKVYSFTQVLNAVFYNCFAIYFVMCGWGVSGVIIASIIATVIVSLFLIYHLRMDISILKFDFHVIKELIRSGIPLVFIASIAWITELSDKYFLNYYINTAEVGLYSFSYKLVTAVAFVNTIFVQTVPMYLFKVRESDRELGEYLQTEVLRYYMIVNLFITLLLSLFVKEIIYILAPKAYHNAYRFVTILAFSYVCYGAYLILHIGIANSKKFHYLSICFLVSGIVNTALNFILIPKYAGLGAAISTVSSYLILALVANYYSQRLYHMSWNYKTPGLLLAIVVMLCFLGSVELFNSWIFMMIYKIGIVFFYCSIVWMIGIKLDERNFLKRFLYSFSS